MAIALPALAGAQESDGGNPLVRQGQELYDELRFEEALQVLSAALIRSGNSPAEQATTLKLLAYTYLALDREAEAEGAYRRLLSLESEFEPEADLSPRFREFFARVRTTWEGEGSSVTTETVAPVRIQHTSPAQADSDSEVELRASLEDPSGRVASVVLAYRQGTSDVFRRLDTRRDGADYVATIPSEDVAPPLVEYYFEGLDEDGVPVAARGDVAAPLRIAVEGEDEGGVVRKWWFWTIIAAVVVGGAVTTAVLLTRPSGNDQGTLVVTVAEM